MTLVLGRNKGGDEEVVDDEEVNEGVLAILKDEMVEKVDLCERKL